MHPMFSPDRLRQNWRRCLTTVVCAAVTPLICTAALAQTGLGVDRWHENRSARDLPPGVELIQDVAYGPHRLQRMDVYKPANSAGATAAGLRSFRSPVIFMVHGGGWRNGDKALGRTVTEKVARWVPKGFVLISINYRLLPETPVDQQYLDVVRALSHAQVRATQWNADPSRFILMGHSAGAHLVALVNAKATQIQGQGAWPWLGTVVLDSGVLNVPARMSEPHLPLYSDAFGSNPLYWVALSPYHQWLPGAPAVQMVCSTDRPDLPCKEAENLRIKAKQMGGRAEVLPQDLSHGDINGLLGEPGAYTDAVEKFMRALDPLVEQLLR